MTAMSITVPWVRRLPQLSTKKVYFTNDHFIQCENCIIELLLTHSKDEIIANIVLHKHEIG